MTKRISGIALTVALILLPCAAQAEVNIEPGSPRALALFGG